ncbi:hypothetical protein ACVWXM_003311 [Bradyrhizobium sp. GM7.3]
MAEEDRRLAGGATFIDFQTEPSPLPALEARG